MKARKYFKDNNALRMDDVLTKMTPESLSWARNLITAVDRTLSDKIEYLKVGQAYYYEKDSIFIEVKPKECERRCNTFGYVAKTTASFRVYQVLWHGLIQERYEEIYPRMIKIFPKGATKVCEKTLVKMGFDLSEPNFLREYTEAFIEWRHEVKLNKGAVVHED